MSAENPAAVKVKETAVSPTSLIMSEPLKHLVHEHLWEFDSDFKKMEAYMFNSRGMTEFGHARQTFKNHLCGTFALCAAWGLPRAVNRCGLFHTTYSGDLFRFCVLRSESSEDRATLRGVIGEDAERLVHLFGSVRRQKVMDHIFENGSLPDSMQVPLNRETDKKALESETVSVSSLNAAAIMMVTVADYLDQLTGCNAWKDIYQVEGEDQVMLWPGSGKPGVAHHWLTKLAKASAPLLPCSVPPAVFENCTGTITEEDETTARDLYWDVVRDDDDKKMSEEQKEEALRKCIQLNRFVGEPHTLLAQILFRKGLHAEASAECQQALRKMYAMCTAWDKRMPWNEWVCFTRITWLRSARLSRGLPEDFPRRENGLCVLEEMVEEIEKLEKEGQEKEETRGRQAG
uniref:DUF6817 domain-containing protein n=1 Tax=Chromera velia CCMP2878 TaxID=1169474 RepID=A0A0G4FJA2_9ALVE|mmetsp:Transcript_16370/g.33280  ORF Transcript_16370/g.33280 Transcript_16370/m.33280 type:complete len:403 (+) Transcript_16370:74-1282(+)|eukprot:Cvel_3367.t1-p1 / transcript=Cvel_3367.t1 / gene=Cvel_3367 / organism=Chromera_velia_CCMP2878 / gene_product=hypothetical protein / transcript_product=hypothetical protein / location=Cvel_scaffold134:113114-114837(+) / protein_length=402 / sequence_SO=supercontig / SO=protein_coding / is_pseudo=false